MTSYPLGNKSFRSLSNKTDERGNTYYLLATSSLFLSIISEAGRKSYNYGDKYFINLVSIILHLDRSLLEIRTFEIRQFDPELVKQTATEILTDYLKKTLEFQNSKLNEIEVEAFANDLIREAFETNQSKIESKLEIFYKGLPDFIKGLPFL